ncbi:hypothetical protein ES707_05778 [subsurface metagenome]
MRSKRNILHIATKYNMRMIILGMPTHPKANPESLSPAKILPPAMAMSNIPIPADAICRNFTSLKSGVRRCNISSKARIVRLNMQLPSRVPSARLGSPTKAAELTPVINSGAEVIAARSTRPIHIPPSPVFSAITSPYRASFVPANRMMTRQARNFNQTKV